ncbi:MAG TPA: DUF5996 family protein [Vicinamibacterales bacterium]|nr:DUF5996 family protein [Vicinamibacterales bacterium]
MTQRVDAQSWPSLPFDAWKDSSQTLHLWLQIVGKIRLAQSPWTNHSWHTTLYLTASGLTTSVMAHGARSFQIDFDFLEHALVIRTDSGRGARIALEPQPVATFYARVMRELTGLGLPVRIYARPNEIPDTVRFEDDTSPRAYDAEYVTRYWRALLQAGRVFTRFRARFIGKCSPVHLFWGAPDLAVTRFSGRRAPVHPGGVPNLPDRVTREAYSHEVSSCGFWAGNAAMPYAAFYAYAYPEPAGFSNAAVLPTGASYNTDFREFILPYDVVRESASPDDTLLEFLQSTYEAAADLAHWDRSELERTTLP